MAKKYIAIFVVLLLFSVDCALAQNKITGRVFDENKDPVIGASVIISGTKNGTTTDFDGNFTISTNQPYPISITISFIGYKSVDFQVKNSSPVAIRIEPDQQILQEVNIVERRLSEKQKTSALTVEALDALAIRETPSVSFYEGLGNLKGVDLMSASIGFKIINTRGFNSTSPVRSLQIIDGVDNQAPGLNFSLGNFLGASDLDVINVDVIAGASTAFYGPNAFNGVISMTTKNPYDFRGLTASIKAGERALTEVSVRYADVIKNKKGEEKFAFKFNIFHLTANDWEATNMNAVDESNFTTTPTPKGNPGGYDAVNRYGDEVFFTDGGDSRTFPGLGIYHRTGIEEQYIVDYDTRNLKIAGALHYRFKPDLELIFASNYGQGTTVYQGDNRFSLKGIQFWQNRLELQKKDKWFIRAYATQEDAGESYDAYFTALKMQDSIINDQFWGNQYRTFWNIFYADSVRRLEGFPAGNIPIDDFRAQMDVLVDQNRDDFLRWHGNVRNIADNFFGTGAYITPGTPEFNGLLNHVRGNYFNDGGSRLFDQSGLYHVQGEYRFDSTRYGRFTVGGNGRLFTPYSRGTIFSDTGNVRITNAEAGVYGGWEKFLMRKRLRVSATMRIDKNQNFDVLASPAVSAIYQIDEINTLRVSVSSAIRNPTLQDQYLYYNTGRAILIGNLNGYDSLVTLENISEFLGKTGQDRERHDWNFARVNPIKPERVRTAEVGYRTTLFSKIFIDANYYYSWYDDFIGFVIAAQGIEVGEIINPFRNLEVYRIATNAEQRVTTQGFSLGSNYYFGKYYSLSGNYTWNILNTKTDDPIVPAFNTPEHKFNISFGARDMRLSSSKWRLGYNLTYKWIEGFRFEGSPQFTGLIDTYDMLDVQASFVNKDWNTTVKIGASNVLNNKVFQVYGGPQVGRLAYIQVLYEWNKK